MHFAEENLFVSRHLLKDWWAILMSLPSEYYSCNNILFRDIVFLDPCFSFWIQVASQATLVTSCDQDSYMVPFFWDDEWFPFYFPNYFINVYVWTILSNTFNFQLILCNLQGFFIIYNFVQKVAMSGKYCLVMVFEDHEAHLWLFIVGEEAT